MRLSRLTRPARRSSLQLLGSPPAASAARGSACRPSSRGRGSERRPGTSRPELGEHRARLAHRPRRGTRGSCTTRAGCRAASADSRSRACTRSRCGFGRVLDDDQPQAVPPLGRAPRPPPSRRRARAPCTRDRPRRAQPVCAPRSGLRLGHRLDLAVDVARRSRCPSGSAAPPPPLACGGSSRG